MSYAVLFKIYFLDSFVLRQLDRLKARVGEGHVYVIADETKGPVGPIPHDRVIRATEAEMLSRGFAKDDPWLSLFWYHADYSLYRLFQDQPGYDYYVTVEYDAVINADLDELVAAVAARNIDFVGQRIPLPISKWGWSRTCEGIYRLEDIRPYLNFIAFYSARAVLALRDKRLELSQRLRNGEIGAFPMSEAYIATELDLQGFTIGNLPDFGDASRSDWWPPTPEAELGNLEYCTFMHPVLEGARCAASLLRGDYLSMLFSPGWEVARRLTLLEPRDYIPTLFPILLNQDRTEPIPFAMEHVGAPLFEESDPSPNIARGKPATQSSISHASRNRSPRDDAGGAVNGLVTGTFGFHTAYDNPPWWMVDLERPYHLAEVWIYNRLDAPSTLRHFKLLTSRNGRDWEVSFEHRSDGNFGGVWGTPLMIEFDGAVARFVRIELAGWGFLHLDQVKVFGTEADQNG